MSGFKVNFSVNNQLATPSIHAAPFAQRPAAGQPGRVFIDTDSPSTGIYRDTGTTWIQIASTSSPEADTLQTVTDRGNTTTRSITVGAATSPVGTIDIRRTTAALNGNNDWAIASNNNPTIASGASFGVNYVNAVYGSQALTFSGNATIGNTGINAAGNFINTLGNNASGTITVAQGSGTIRAIAGVQAGIYYNTPNAMTFTHVAGIKTLQPINSGAVGASVTNYYGVQIADSTPSSGTISYTNRWGIYQEGANDVNYFAGRVGIGNVSPSPFNLLINTTSGYGVGVYNPANNNQQTQINAGSLVLGDGSSNFATIENQASAGTLTYGSRIHWFRVGSTTAMYIPNNGNVIIGSTVDAGYRLDCTGTMRVSGTELRLDNGTTGTINLYSATPSIQFAAGDPTNYRLYRSATNMILNSGGAIIQQIGGNNAYQIDATNGHLFRSAIAGGASLARMTTGGNWILGGTTDNGQRLQIVGSLRIDGQSSPTAGGSSGQHLIINLDGTTYKIALLNP